MGNRNTDTYNRSFCQIAECSSGLCRAPNQSSNIYIWCIAFPSSSSSKFYWRPKAPDGLTQVLSPGACWTHAKKRCICHIKRQRLSPYPQSLLPPHARRPATLPCTLPSWAVPPHLFIFVHNKSSAESRACCGALFFVLPTQLSFVMCKMYSWLGTMGGKYIISEVKSWLVTCLIKTVSLKTGFKWWQITGAR